MKTNLEKYWEGRERIQQILIEQTCEAILKDVEVIVPYAELSPERWNDLMLEIKNILNNNHKGGEKDE